MAKYTDRAFLSLLGSRLKKLREQKGITQAQLAIDCDMEISAISRIERGVVNTSVSNIKLIADALEIEAWELIKV